MAAHDSKGKKRKRIERHSQDNGTKPNSSDAVDTSKPTAVYKAVKGRSHTLSLAVPSSIVTNCQTPELKAQIAGQIARAAAVFAVDEIVVFNDNDSSRLPGGHSNGGEDGYTGYTDPTDFLYHVFSYLETPPYLRRALFAMHANLRHAGALPSLDMPHHLRTGEQCPYREGVTVRAADDHAGGGTWVDAGTGRELLIADSVEASVRVTLRLDDSRTGAHTAAAVAPDEPRTRDGFYWGFSTRRADSLSAVFTESPFDEGYDVSFGTSERGKPLSGMHVTGEGSLGQWQHLLVVFGGVAGLEAALAVDRELKDKGVQEVSELFDQWVNVLPNQGSRTIRTEEAVWIGLMGLRRFVVERER